MIIDFGLAELDPTYIVKLQERVSKMKQANDPNYKATDETLKIYKRLTECLKTIGNNKIGT